MTILTRH